MSTELVIAWFSSMLTVSLVGAVAFAIALLGLDDGFGGDGVGQLLPNHGLGNGRVQIRRLLDGKIAAGPLDRFTHKSSLWNILARQTIKTQSVAMVCGPQAKRNKNPAKAQKTPLPIVV